MHMLLILGIITFVVYTVWAVWGQAICSALFGNRTRAIRTLLAFSGITIGLLILGYKYCYNAEFIQPIVVSTLASLGLLLFTLGILFACTNPEKVRRAVSFPIWKYGLFISFLMTIFGIVFSLTN